MKKLLVLLLAVFLCACSKKIPGPEQTASEESRWQKLEAASLANPHDPFRLQLSMRFGDEGDTRRVTALLWGNTPELMRLDVMAGVGVVVAKIMEKGDDFLIYAPRENKAFSHSGPTKPLLKIGVPLPFDLAQLASLLTGHYSAVFGQTYSQAKIGKSGQISYELNGKLKGWLDIDENGLPVSWSQQSGGWKLAVSYDDSVPPLPRGLKLTNLNGKRAILLVKDREKVDSKFDDASLILTPPTGTPVLPLSQYKPS